MKRDQKKRKKQKEWNGKLDMKSSTFPTLSIGHQKDGTKIVYATVKEVDLSDTDIRDSSEADILEMFNKE